MDSKDTGRVAVNWIYLAGDSNYWLFVLNTATNLRISRKMEIYLRSSRKCILCVVCKVMVRFLVLEISARDQQKYMNLSLMNF